MRAHNVRDRIRIRVDNGVEFCSGSDRKLRWWNEILRPLGVEVEVEVIPPGARYLMVIVEASHRTDDEYFLMLHPDWCSNMWEFIGRATEVAGHMELLQAKL